jgi:hypothetical protein
MIFWEVVIILSIVTGLVISYVRHRPKPVSYDHSGWVYFIGSKTNSEDAPIRISITTMDPRMELRMLQASSPDKLEIIHAFHCTEAPLVCAQIQDDLKAYHVHGDWYDRDAARAYLTMITSGVM